MSNEGGVFRLWLPLDLWVDGTSLRPKNMLCEGPLGHRGVDTGGILRLSPPVAHHLDVI